jgi:methionyl-tRNA formyltransferase
MICIAGKNEIAVRAAEYLRKTYPELEMVACVNQNDDGVNGWQRSYKFYCEQNGIAICPVKDLYDRGDLIFISLEFDRIIRPDKFKTSRLYNIHFSLLPAYKGMFTSVMPLIKGESKSGVTLHLIDKGIDTGEIIDQVAFELSAEINARDLYDLYLDHAFNVFSVNIQSLIDGTITSRPQPAAGASYYSKNEINFGEVVIDLNKTAFEIHNKIRAFSFRDYQLPVVFNKPVYKSIIIDERATGKPGSIISEEEWSIRINAIDYQLNLMFDQSAALFNAAEKGDIDFIQAAATNNFPINVRNKKGWNLLIVAVYNNQIALVSWLLENGFNLNDQNYNGTTVMMYAMTQCSSSGDLQMLKMLLQQSPNLTARDDRGLNIFQYAVQYGNAEVIKLLTLVPSS